MPGSNSPHGHGSAASAHHQQRAHGDSGRLSRISPHSDYQTVASSELASLSSSLPSARISEYTALQPHYRYWGTRLDASAAASEDSELQLLRHQRSSALSAWAYTLLAAIALLLLAAGVVIYQRHLQALSIVLPPVILIPDLYCSQLEFILQRDHSNDDRLSDSSRTSPRARNRNQHRRASSDEPSSEQQYSHPDLSMCPTWSHSHAISVYNSSMHRPPLSSCLVAALSMNYDEHQQQFVNQPDVQVRSSAFGKLDGIVINEADYTSYHPPSRPVPDTSETRFSSFYAFYYAAVSDTQPAPPHTPCQYKRLVDTLLEMGYTEGDTLLTAPYDWRRSPQAMAKEAFEQPLREMIERAASDSGRRVQLIAHGAGTDHILHFLAQQPREWLERYVKHLIALDSDAAGNREHPLAVVSGIAVQAQRLLPLPPEQCLQIYQSSSYYANKLPASGTEHMKKVPLIDTPSQFYTAAAPDLRDLLNRAGASDLSRLMTPQHIRQSLDAEPWRELPDVDVIGVLPSDVPSVQTYMYNDDDLLTLPAVLYTILPSANHSHDSRKEEQSADATPIHGMDLLFERWEKRVSELLDSADGRKRDRIPFVGHLHVDGASRAMLPAAPETIELIRRQIDRHHERHRSGQ